MCVYQTGLKYLFVYVFAEKNKKRYTFLSPKKSSAKNKASQDSMTGSFKTPQDLKPLIDSKLDLCGLWIIVTL